MYDENKESRQFFREALSKGIASQEASRQRHLGSHDGKTGSAVGFPVPIN